MVLLHTTDQKIQEIKEQKTEKINTVKTISRSLSLQEKSERINTLVGEVGAAFCKEAMFLTTIVVVRRDSEGKHRSLFRVVLSQGTAVFGERVKFQEEELEVLPINIVVFLPSCSASVDRGPTLPCWRETSMGACLLT